MAFLETAPTVEICFMHICTRHFCRLTPEEFSLVCKSFNERRENDHHSGWERARMLAAIVVQPHCKNKIQPEQLLQFPWDGKHEDEAPRMSKEEQLKRMEEIRKEWESELT